MHALILSDLHLGARNCQHELIHQRLSEDSLRSVDSIILNGDVVDHLNFEYFRPADWSVLARFKELAREDRLVVVQGNHDRPKRSLPGCMSHALLSDILNIELQLELTLCIDGLRYLLLHGDQYDQTLNMSTLGTVAEAFYRQTQRWHQPASRWLKRQSKQLLGIEDAVRKKALNDARQRGFAGIILGHTHHADDAMDSFGTHYLNSGSWVDDACTYLEIQDETIALKYWDGESLGCQHPLETFSQVDMVVPAYRKTPVQRLGLSYH